VANQRSRQCLVRSSIRRHGQRAFLSPELLLFPLFLWLGSSIGFRVRHWNPDRSPRSDHPCRFTFTVSPAHRRAIATAGRDLYITTGGAQFVFPSHLTNYVDAGSLTTAQETNCLFLAVGLTHAASYYVSSTGMTQWKPYSSGAPWRTLGALGSRLESATLSTLVRMVPRLPAMQPVPRDRTNITSSLPSSRYSPRWLSSPPWRPTRLPRTSGLSIPGDGLIAQARRTDVRSENSASVFHAEQ